MDSPTLFGQVQDNITSITNDIQTYNSTLHTSDLESNYITRKISSLKNNIETIGLYLPLMNEQSLKNNTSLVNKQTELTDLIKQNIISPSSVISKQREVDTLRGRINNSKLVYKSRVFIYIIYIFITLIIIGGLVSMYWFPSKGRLDIFIAIIAVLLLLLTFYQ